MKNIYTKNKNLDILKKNFYKIVSFKFIKELFKN